MTPLHRTSRFVLNHKTETLFYHCTLKVLLSIWIPGHQQTNTCRNSLILYVRTILSSSLEDLVSRANGRVGGGGDESSGGGGGRSNGGGGSDSSGGNCGSGGGATATKRKSSSTRGDVRVQVRYNSHLPALSLQYRGSTCLILVGTVLPTLHSAVLCKNCHLCGSCWEDCQRKRSHVPTPPELATTVAGLLKAAQGE